MLVIWVICLNCHFLLSTDIPVESLDVTPKSAVTGLHQVTVLSKADWDRIQFQLNRRRMEEERIQRLKEEQQRLHELSLEQVKNWSNTILVCVYLVLITVIRNSLYSRRLL